MLAVLCLSVIAAILLACLCWTRQILKYKSIAHVPGPRPLPIIGNFLLFRNLNVGKLCKKYGPLVRLWLGCTPVLISKDPEMAEFILRSPTFTSKGDMYRYIKPWLTNSMLTSSGETWHRQKKFMSASMNFKLLEKYLSIFNSSCDILVEILSAKADGNTCNIAPLMSSYTLDNIVEVAMGAKLNSQRQPNNEYARALFIMERIFVERSFSVWKSNDFLFMFSKDYRQQQEACNVLNDFATRIVEERRRQLLSEGNEDMDDDEVKMIRVVDILLNPTVNGKPLSEEEIRDDLSGFIFGGHDTTATVLELLFYLLSNNREIQNKIVDELKEIYGNDKNRPTTMEDMCKMKYMERVIKESMRYNAPVPFIARTLEEDVHYKNTILPKGLNLLFFMYGLHRNPDIYEHPDVFDPDRFSSEDSIKPYSFLPFSGGPRNCKGQKFALLELKVTVAKLLRNFEFLPSGSELKLLPCMVLNGVHVRMKCRDF